jgi:hypothetical protein
MTTKDIITKVQTLNLPKGSYIVFGSCPMALAGIRESSDIDMLVTEEVFNLLEKAGWQTINKGMNDNPLAFEDFEAHKNWNFSSYQPTLDQLLRTATVTENIPFASLAEVKKWKQSSGRPKDLVDIALIDNYLQKAQTS